MTALTINSAYIHLINKVEVVDIYLYCVFIRIAQINRLRVVSIHESNQAFNKIIYILERTGLFTRTVYGDILALKGLLVEQRNKNQKKQTVRIKSSQIRSNQVKSNQVKSSQIRSNQVKSDQTRSIKVKSSPVN